MRSRQRHHVGEAVAREFRAHGFFVGAVDLVDHQHGRPRQFAQPGQNLVIERGRAFAAIDHEQHQIGFAGGGPCLAGRGPGKTFLVAGDTTGIDDDERLLLVETADPVVAVASDAWLVVNQRVTGARQRIEDGGLADIGPSNQGDQGQHRKVLIVPTGRR